MKMKRNNHLNEEILCLRKIKTRKKNSQNKKKKKTKKKKKYNIIDVK
jgi:hypothetical protein